MTTLNGQHNQNNASTPTGTVRRLFMKVMKFPSHLLLQTTPRMVMALLTNIMKWELRLNSSHPGHLNQVFDIVNVGDKHRFTVMTSKGPALAHNCQNTGHTVLMVLNKHMRDQIQAAGIKSHRPVIQDFHDETIRTCRIDEAEKMAEAMNRAVDRLNDELQPQIPFSGTAELGTSIWEFKR